MLSGFWVPSAPAVTLHLASGLPLKQVKDFKYLGTWLLSSMNDFQTRRSAAWSAIKRLNRIWTATNGYFYSLETAALQLPNSIYSTLQCNYLDNEQDSYEGPHRWL